MTLRKMSLLFLIISLTSVLTQNSHARSETTATSSRKRSANGKGTKEGVTEVPQPLTYFMPGGELRAYSREGQTPVAKFTDAMKPREDHFDPPIYFDQDVLRIHSNDAVVSDLRIDETIARLIDLVPYGVVANRAYTQNPYDQVSAWINLEMHFPLTDVDAMLERQTTFRELRDPALAERFAKLVGASQRFKWERHYSLRYQNHVVQGLENAAMFVDFVEASTALGDNLQSAQLAELHEFGSKLGKDERFKTLINFVNQIYRPYNLSDAFAEVLNILAVEPKNSELRKNISVRSRFNEQLRQILEGIDRLSTESAYEGYLPRTAEIGDVQAARQLAKQVSLSTFELLNQMTETSPEYIEAFLTAKGGNLVDVITFYLGYLDKFRRATEPNQNRHLTDPDQMELGFLPHRLSFLAAAAALHGEWVTKGASLTPPTILDPFEKRVSATGVLNIGMLNDSNFVAPKVEAAAGETAAPVAVEATAPARRKVKADNRIPIVPFDIISTPDENLFLITGPNAGGKSSFMRTIGELYYYAQLGFPIPTAGESKIELSMVDGVFTSLEKKDDPSSGDSQYAAELRRVRDIFSVNGATGLSLVLLDEPTTGTNPEESTTRLNVLTRGFSVLGSHTYIATHNHHFVDLAVKQAQNGELDGLQVLSLSEEGAETGQWTRKVIRGWHGRSLGENVAGMFGVTFDGILGMIQARVVGANIRADSTRMDAYGLGTGFLRTRELKNSRIATWPDAEFKDHGNGVHYGEVVIANRKPGTVRKPPGLGFAVPIGSPRPKETVTTD